MGSIGARNGILQFDFRYDGQRIRESSGLRENRANRRVCETKLRKMMAEISLGCFDPIAHFPDSTAIADRFASASLEAEKREVCFANFAEQWFIEKRVEWRQSYESTIRITLDNYLIPTFGGQAVDEITKPMILEFRVSLASIPGMGDARSLSASRINHIMTPLRMILTEAADRYDFHNPWQNIKPLKEPRTQVEPFTLDEVKKILRNVRSDYRAYYTVRFFTGLRSSEVDGLKWQYVDFERRQILVREALVQGHMVPTKTDGSMRDIDMNSLVFDALQKHRKETVHRSDFVFCSSTSQPLANRNVTRRVWYPMLKYLGLKARRPYQTRHTAATLWLASGESPEWIARQMGHTTTEMLFRVYSRYVPNLTRQDGSAFEQLLATRFVVARQDQQTRM
ncbi:MAG: tyrosine-type recombinase/integrase [Kordiimonadaceae bacterium]|nr:tyrosine-type recombinase/integrase [Kordiimonadaceae bacterium]MBO6568570.1 tyrosine-type recombinase/integrase [Kordiimonadaceae bacterium]MBO6963701.1 tyrosine-type recombinase/integrase [Kordiimonadaceae bacterium]